MIKRLLLSFCTIITLIGSFHAGNSFAAQAQTNYVFAYASQPQTDGRVYIKTISPANPTTSQILLTVSIPNNAYVLAVTSSPNGKWFAIAYTGGVIRIVNVLTHEAHEIPLMAVFNTGDAFISGPSQYFAWSPDSRYVALIGRINNTENMENAYLYNVQTNSLSAINADVAQKFRVAWSTDSGRLATLSEYCSTINTCSDFIETFDIPNLNRLSSVKVVDIGVSNFDIVVCDIAWSPDATYISFARSCDLSGHGPTRELYVLNVDQAIITPVTNYTVKTTDPDTGGPPLDRFAAYHPIWLDSQTILIGATFRNNAGSYSDYLTQTIAFHVTNRQTSVLSSTMAKDWAKNPLTGELAFRASMLNSNGLTPLDAQYSSVQLGFFNGNYIQSSVTAPTGCDLKWSQNGAFLAYDQRSGFAHDCTDPIQSFVFINANGQIKQLTIPASEKAIVAGWLTSGTQLSSSDLQAKLGMCVTDKGLLTSLNAKIDAQSWNAFINEVEAQSGKKIAPNCASQLIKMDTYLLSNSRPADTPEPRNQ